jgi:Fe2+ transport system protein FeoA
MTDIEALELALADAAAAARDAVAKSEAAITAKNEAQIALNVARLRAIGVEPEKTICIIRNGLGGTRAVITVNMYGYIKATPLTKMNTKHKARSSIFVTDLTRVTPTTDVIAGEPYNVRQ